MLRPLFLLLGLHGATGQELRPFGAGPPPSPLVPNGYNVCVRNRASRDPHDLEGCNVGIGLRPCDSQSYPDYKGKMCLYIDKPFFHAFVCGVCTTQGHVDEGDITQCLISDNNDRFTVLRTGAGFSISVSQGKGHPDYNTVRGTRERGAVANPSAPPCLLRLRLRTRAAPLIIRSNRPISCFFA